MVIKRSLYYSLANGISLNNFSAKGQRSAHGKVSILCRTNQGTDQTPRIAAETDAIQKTSKEILKRKESNSECRSNKYFLYRVIFHNS